MSGEAALGAADIENQISLEGRRKNPPKACCDPSLASEPLDQPVDDWMRNEASGEPLQKAEERHRRRYTTTRRPLVRGSNLRTS